MVDGEQRLQLFILLANTWTVANGILLKHFELSTFCVAHSKTSGFVVVSMEIDGLDSCTQFEI